MYASTAFFGLNKNFDPVAYTNLLYSYEINAIDPDGDQLNYSLMESPTGMNLSANGSINWIPETSQIGRHFVHLHVDDGRGLADSSKFWITVLDSMTSKGSISFNKSMYDNYEDIGMLTLSDINLNVSKTSIDSHIVTLFSNSDKNGISLIAHENEANSGQFFTTFKFDSISSSTNSILVSAHDSLWAEYIDEFPLDTIKTVCEFRSTLPTKIENEFIITKSLKEFKLNQNYPNPFNPETIISFDLPKSSSVDIRIYDVLGKLVCNLIEDKFFDAGVHTIRWNGLNKNGEHITAGVYILKMRTGEHNKTIKMLLIK